MQKNTKYAVKHPKQPSQYRPQDIFSASVKIPLMAFIVFSKTDFSIWKQTQIM